MGGLFKNKLSQPGQQVGLLHQKTFFEKVLFQKRLSRAAQTAPPGARSSIDDVTSLPFAAKHTRALSQSVQHQLEAEVAKRKEPAPSVGGSASPQVPWSAELPTTAGGVVIFNIAPDEPFCILVQQTSTYPKPPARKAIKGSKKPEYLMLRIGETSAGFYIKYDDGTEDLKCQASLILYPFLQDWRQLP